ncbi:hypothetical protein IWQ57_003368, partial [Coemansia nantahalensis]
QKDAPAVDAHRGGAPHQPHCVRAAATEPDPPGLRRAHEPGHDPERPSTGKPPRHGPEHPQQGRHPGPRGPVHPGTRGREPGPAHAPRGHPPRRPTDAPFVAGPGCLLGVAKPAAV